MLNTAVVIGKLIKSPDVRALPSGISLASFDLQVKRAGQPTSTVPVALFDGTERVHDWHAGDDIFVIGQVRRRFFRGAAGTQSRTELVAENVALLSEKELVSSSLVEARANITRAISELRSSRGKR